MHSDDYPEMRADHIGVSVPDIEASIAWYGRMFGFTLELRRHLPLIPAEIAFLRRGELRIELFQVDGAKPLPPERRSPTMIFAPTVTSIHAIAWPTCPAP